MRTLRTLVVGLLASFFGSTAWAAFCYGFTDVDSQASYCTAVAYLADHGITLGCSGPNAYCPNDYVTRAQLALFVHRMAQSDPTNTLAEHSSAAIGGGTFITASAQNSFVGGGYHNSATDVATSVLGGEENVASSNYAVVGGGTFNVASSIGSAVMGGQGNIASGLDAAIGGGTNNTASGIFSAVPGGNSNTASGAVSFAFGVHALADEAGCALFALWSSFPEFGCKGWSNVVRIGADNGMRIDYGAPNGDGNSDSFVYIGPQVNGQAISTGTGAFLSIGGTWTNSSDRAAKTNLEAVDSRAVLDHVISMPMETWSYKAETGQRHLGPMAQDFYAAFGLGSDDKHIATIDEGGVALAAIQGLHQMLLARDSVIAGQAHELAEIKAQLAAMAAAH